MLYIRLNRLCQKSRLVKVWFQSSQSPGEGVHQHLQAYYRLEHRTLLISGFKVSALTIPCICKVSHPNRAKC